VNLSTGNHTRIYDRVRPYGNPRDADWHDVDLVSDDRLLVGDIQNNQAFVVNITTGVIEWGWNAQAEYSINETGGAYPSAWTHLNDVEMVDNDRMMLSLRDQDSVVFIDRDSGLDERYTLGEPDNYSFLYEQHNPDFIPEERGGPAIIVADSENDRILEYQRENGTWRQRWFWRDDQLSWPRDADRLPNGNTLITDTNGQRIIEVDQSGDIVWNMSVASPYEAERLNTGDESAGGPAASRAGIESRSAEAASDFKKPVILQIRAALYDLTPNKLRHGVEFILPKWMGIFEAIALSIGFLCAVTWSITEARWRGYRFRSPLTRQQ
jgi:outer membrane protein assembly factor BamB